MNPISEIIITGTICTIFLALVGTFCYVVYKTIREIWK